MTPWVLQMITSNLIFEITRACLPTRMSLMASYGYLDHALANIPWQHKSLV